METTKKPWLSKTMAAAAIVALAGRIPAVQVVVAADPGLVTTVVGLLFAALRAVSKGRIALSDD